MDMYYSNAVESFLDFCDTRTIANEGLGQTIKNGWNWIVEKIKAIKDRIVQFVKKLFGKTVDENGSNGTDKAAEVITNAEKELNDRDTTSNTLNKIATQLDAISNQNKQLFKDSKKLVTEIESLQEEIDEVKEDLKSVPNETVTDNKKLNALKSKIQGLLKRTKYHTEQARQVAKNNNLDGIKDTRGHLLWVEKNLTNIQAAGNNVGKIMQLAQKTDGNNMSTVEDMGLTNVVADLNKTLENMNSSLSSHDRKGYDSNMGSTYPKNKVKQILGQIDGLANTANQWKGPVEKMTKEGNKNLSKAMQAATKYISMVDKCLSMVCTTIGGGSEH